VPGLARKRIQSLLCGLLGNVNTYLEVGSAMGATAAAVGLNDNVEIHCVDNWSQTIQPQQGAFALPNNTLEEFKKNTSHVRNLHIHNTDYLNFNRDLFYKKIDMFFYDGPHSIEETKRAVEYYAPLFNDTAILIFDDANWTDVVQGAEAGIASAGLNLIYNRLVLNEIENPNMWWNGLYVTVVQK